MYGMHHHCRRGGSRILWFIIGGVSTAWWLKARDGVPNSQFGCTWRHRRELAAARGADAPASAEPWGFHPRPAVPAAPPAPVGAPIPVPSAHQGDVEKPAAAGASAQMSWDAVQHERWADEQRARAAAAQQWEEEKDQLRQFKKQAELKMTDFSEATLDHIMSTAQALKTKVAERRAQQEQQRLREEQIAEEQRRSPTRWV